jgi:hypothetical protein
VAAKVNRSDGGLPDLQDGLVFRMSALTAGAVRDGMSTTYLLGEKYVAGGLAGAGTDAGDTAPLFVGYSDDNLRWAYAAGVRQSAYRRGEHVLRRRERQVDPLRNRSGGAQGTGRTE